MVPASKAGRCTDHRGMISTIVKELCEVEGLNDKETPARPGRDKGFNCCRENALGETAAENSRTTSTPGAWRRSANWLRGIGRTKDKKVAYAVVWKLLHYVHPQPSPALATQEQLAAMKVFQRVANHTDQRPAVHAPGRETSGLGRQCCRHFLRGEMDILAS